MVVSRRHGALNRSVLASYVLGHILTSVFLMCDPASQKTREGRQTTGGDEDSHGQKIGHSLGMQLAGPGCSQAAKGGSEGGLRAKSGSGQFPNALKSCPTMVCSST